ncbi:hypothetical protein [Lentilactobacillus parabuchneri]|nr:hypothetical protein [Lentilactobacillus parabuchneri]KRN78042.1 hypothetical protein IV42_GL002340 [Lentilactobacillus parabuchneri]
MWFDVAIAVVGILCSLIVLLFYRKDVVPQPNNKDIILNKPEDVQTQSNFEIKEEY